MISLEKTVVIYNEQMRPLTVIDLPESVRRSLLDSGYAVLRFTDTSSKPGLIAFMEAHIRLEEFRTRHGKAAGFVILEAPELDARKLPCSFLPAQVIESSLIRLSRAVSQKNMERGTHASY